MEKTFVEFMGVKAFRKLVGDLESYEHARKRLSNLEGFMQLSEELYSDVQQGNLQFFDAFDLMSDILTKYIFVGDDCFGRTKEVCELVTKMDKLCDRIIRLDLC